MNLDFTRQSEHTRGLLAAGVVVLCWSGFNIVSRLGSKGMLTPFDIAAMRFGVSALLAAPVFLARVPPREWPRYMALAAFGGVGYSVLVYSGFAFAPTAHAGVFVNGGIPFWTIVLLAMARGYKLQRHVVAAMLLSGCGLVLIGFDSLVQAHAGSQWRGDVLFLLAAANWAIFGLLMRRWQVKPVLAITGVATFSAAAYLPIYVLWLPGTIGSALPSEIMLQCFYQGIVAALLAGSMYSYANQKIGPSLASMMLALVPGVSAVGAWFILAEPLSPKIIAGIMVVTLGAVLCALPSRRQV